MNNIFDVVIIGGGVIGCSIARYLSKYQGNFLVVEKHNDVGEETSNANSAIVHSGYDPDPGTLKAKFNVLGNKMMPQLCKELDVPFKQIGSLTLALNDDDLHTLDDLMERAKLNGVNAKLLNREETLEIEPNINDAVKGSILCPDAGIVSPFNLTVSLMENAMDNGVKLSLNTEIVKIEKENNLFVLHDKLGKVFYAKFLINATGVDSEMVTRYLEEPTFHINPTKGEYILLDHFATKWVKHTLFMCPSKVGKGVLVSPTTSFNYIIGPSANPTISGDVSCDYETYAFLREKAKNLVTTIPYNETIKGFAGVRANNDRNDFIIEESKVNSNFYQVSGIMSPGLASSPAIGEYVANFAAERLALNINTTFKANIRQHKSLSSLSLNQYNDLIKKEPSYGKFICRCEKVTEGEIIDVIHRNCGAHTIKGVRKRVRAGFGKCQGTFCQSEVLKILSRELNLDPKEICYGDLGTNILIEESKEAK